VVLHRGEIRSFTVLPEDAGLQRAPVAAIKGDGPEQNAEALLALLLGAAGPYRDTVVLNAAAGLVIAEQADDLRHGAMLASAALDDGAALAVLDRLRRETA